MTLDLDPALKPRRMSLGVDVVCPGSGCGRRALVHDGGHLHGTLAMHATAHGPICGASRMPVTAEAAIARDDRLTPAETAVRDDVFRGEIACRGYDSPGVPCSHPVCHPKKPKRRAAARRIARVAQRQTQPP